MKRARIAVLTWGILDIIIAGSLILVFHYEFILQWGVLGAFTWGLPVLIAMLLALICGIYTVKRKRWRWALASLIFSVAGWAYFLILWWFTLW